MSLPRYPDYKDSGVEWLGTVPSHWEIVRYKNVFRERDERSADGSETLLSVSAYTGVSPRSEIVDKGEHLSRAESLEGYKVCYPDDLVMNIMLAWNRGLGVTAYHGIVSPAYSVFKVTNGACPRFLDYAMRSDQSILYYKAFSSGVIDSRLRLYPDTFGALFCSLPPKKEQQAIATFLDRETAKIDALIAEQEKLLTLLAEKRQATISHAVTRGLDPNAPMKDSGIPWLGEVPAHWEIWKVRHAFDVIGSGTTPPSDEAQWYEDGVMPWVTTGELRESVIYETSKCVTADALARFSALRVHPAGSLLIAMYGATIGRLGILGVPATSNQACCALSGSCNLEMRFAFYWLQGFKQLLIELFATGGGQPNINQETIASLRVPAPSTDEQREIVSFLDGEAGRIDMLRLQAGRGIEVLKERRSALIAAAVTGQIDVRGLVEAQAT